MCRLFKMKSFLYIPNFCEAVSFFNYTVLFIELFVH